MRIVACCAMAIAALSVTIVGGVSPGAQDAERGPTVLEKFLAPAPTPLVRYEAKRRMHVVARGGKMQASMVARTTLDPVAGFRYEVLEESGSGFLRGRVLHPILEAEQDAKKRTEGGSHGALTPANYKFTVKDLPQDGFQRVNISPVRKDDLLMEGSILLSCEDGDLVRMEGLLVKRPSFWTRRVQIIRIYGRINGVRVPLSTQSNADVLFAGQSSFTMQYDYESINGVPIAPVEITAGR